jgi:D-glycero-D-manno-heptose 1,7-bisphosphate phosphatase
MVEFHGKPFLQYVVEMLRDQGFTRILLLLGYLPDVVINHFGDGSALGVEIDYGVTAPDDLTAYRVQDAADEIDEEFLLLYCDNYWPMQFHKMWDAYVSSGAVAQVTVYTNEDDYTRDSVAVGEDGFVKVFDRERCAPGLRGVEISYAILRKSQILPLLPEHQELFEQAVYPELTRRGQLHAYLTEHRYYSVGSHARLPLTEEFLARRSTVILDRDGVLNERPPKARYVRQPSDFRWLPGAPEALLMLSEAGYRVIVVSNQAGIGRGMMTEGQLESVHERMRAEAAEAGGCIDAVYYCPHAWDAGCSCRKPRPGMLFRAQREHHLDLTRTWFIGDDERDEEAADAAGCPFLYVSDNTPLLSVIRRLLAGEIEEAKACV